MHDVRIPALVHEVFMQVVDHAGEVHDAIPWVRQVRAIQNRQSSPCPSSAFKGKEQVKHAHKQQVGLSKII